MKITNLLLAINAVLIASLLGVAIHISRQIPNYPTIGEIKNLRSNPAALAKRQGDRLSIAPIYVENQTLGVSIENIQPVAVEITNRPEVEIVRSITLPIETYGDAIDVHIVR